MDQVDDRASTDSVVSDAVLAVITDRKMLGKAALIA